MWKKSSDTISVRYFKKILHPFVALFVADNNMFKVWLFNDSVKNVVFVCLTIHFYTNLILVEKNKLHRIYYFIELEKVKQ